MEPNHPLRTKLSSDRSSKEAEETLAPTELLVVAGQAAGTASLYPEKAPRDAVVGGRLHCYRIRTTILVTWSLEEHGF